MRITITPTTGNPITEFDMSGTGKEGAFGLSGSFSSLVQSAQFLRADQARNFDRKNQSCSLSFSNRRFFASMDLAYVYALKLQTSCPTSGTVRLYVSDAISLYIYNAVRGQIDFEPITGVSVKFNWRIMGGIIA